MNQRWRMSGSNRLQKLVGNLGVLNIAHRGTRAFAPENTLSAIRKAAALGAHMVEVDVHVSRDGELVVVHDDTLERCSDAATRFPDRAPWFVSDFDLSELKQLNAGSWFLHELEMPVSERQEFLRSLTNDEIEQYIRDDDRATFARDVRIPTLTECFDLAIELGLRVNVELKTIPRLYSGMAQQVVELIHARDLQESVLVSSFDHWQLTEVRRLSDGIATGVLSCDRLASVPQYLSRLDADTWHPGCQGEYDSLGFGSVDGELQTQEIQETLQAGFGVLPWTANAGTQIDALIKAGVSGIISDFPNRVRDVTKHGGPV